MAAASSETGAPRAPVGPVTAWIGLGANLGEARATLARAVQVLDTLPATRRLAVSPLYRSAPWQAQGPDYLNAVVAVHTALEAPALLQALQAIEAAEGRLRPYPNAPRTLDLDLLMHGSTRLQTPQLTVPHPRLHERAFVLRPWADLAPLTEVPGHGRVVELLAQLGDQDAAPVAAQGWWQPAV